MDLNSFKQVLETTDEKKVKKSKEDAKLMPPPLPRPVGTNLVYQQPTSPPRPPPGNNLTLNQRVALAVGGDTREMFLKW
jgi:hypothetical protein